MDLSVHLISHDPSDLGSLILIRIISKECTHSVALFFRTVQLLDDFLEYEVICKTNLLEIEH